LNEFDESLPGLLAAACFLGDDFRNAAADVFAFGYKLINVNLRGLTNFV
jgi:hypothetical protein